MSLIVDQSWIKEWVDRSKAPIPFPEEGVEWIRSRPKNIWTLMLRFPPSCLVMANRPLKCPALFTVGIVTSYIEPDDEDRDGTLTVRQHPDSDFRAVCSPDWLRVIGHFRSLVTPGMIREALGL